MDHDAKWDVMEAARKSSTSTRTASKILQNQSAFGGSPGAGDTWVNKKNWMYDNNSTRVFSGIHHINLCTDGSSVDGVSYNFAIAYGWEVNEGCVGNVQVINQGKILLPTDHDLEEDLEPLRSSGQLVRVASFRHMQAHSALSQQLTGRKLSDYEASSLGLNLAAVQPRTRSADDIYFPVVKSLTFDDVLFLILVQRARKRARSFPSPNVLERRAFFVRTPTRPSHPYVDRSSS